MEWDAFLASKKIDSGAFQKNEPALWSEWKALFEQMHPKSFIAQKLYLINPIRRKYLLQEEVSTSPAAAKKTVRPLVKTAKPNLQAKPKTVPAKPKLQVKPKVDPADPKVKIKPKINPAKPGLQAKPKVTPAKPIIKRPKTD